MKTLAPERWFWQGMSSLVAGQVQLIGLADQLQPARLALPPAGQLLPAPALRLCLE